ncbi:MAG TPA: hypothetical protein P5121_29095, partial [Caldilineaceae bacterium]|nr:hypothetical protein [Caldilineaceae bacterium]
MKRTIVLSEYQPRLFPADALCEATAQRLWQHHARLVSVDFPSPKTAGQWQLTAQGWVGIVPVAPDLTLVLQPKVAIAHTGTPTIEGQQVLQLIQPRRRPTQHRVSLLWAERLQRLLVCGPQRWQIGPQLLDREIAAEDAAVGPEYPDCFANHQRDERG